jgi:hypothetical protein
VTLLALRSSALDRYATQEPLLPLSPVQACAQDIYMVYPGTNVVKMGLFERGSSPPKFFFLQVTYTNHTGFRVS